MRAWINLINFDFRILSFVFCVVFLPFYLFFVRILPFAMIPLLRDRSNGTEKESVRLGSDRLPTVFLSLTDLLICYCLRTSLLPNPDVIMIHFVYAFSNWNIFGKVSASAGATLFCECDPSRTSEASLIREFRENCVFFVWHAL